MEENIPKMVIIFVCRLHGCMCIAINQVLEFEKEEDTASVVCITINKVFEFEKEKDTACVVINMLSY